MTTPRYALKFISGKYQGGEFPLREGETVIGRASDLDLVLLEDMVSRMHAKVVTRGDEVSLHDLDSTNGTFVNGERVHEVPLRVGDRILIGSSIIRLVSLDGTPAPMPSPEPEPAAPDAALGLTTTMMSRVSVSTQVPKPMSGTIDEIAIPDLLQMLCTSRKSGGLVLRSDQGVGKIYLRKGQVYHALIEESPELPARKAFNRLFQWKHGLFELDPGESCEVAEELTEPIDGLLLDAAREQDELAQLPQMPDRMATLVVPVPLAPPLRDLKPEELDVVQLALNYGGVQAILDHAPMPDLEAATLLSSLVTRGYLAIAS